MEKQNGEGSRLPLYKRAQLKIYLLTVRTQKGSRDLHHSIAQRLHVFSGESRDCVNLIAKTFYVG